MPLNRTVSYRTKFQSTFNLTAMVPMRQAQSTKMCIRHMFYIWSNFQMSDGPKIYLVFFQIVMFTYFVKKLLKNLASKLSLCPSS